MAKLEALRTEKGRRAPAPKASPAPAKTPLARSRASRGVQRLRAAEQKHRREAARLARQEAQGLLAAERLQAQRVLDRVRRHTGLYPPQVLQSWWFNIAHDVRASIEVEFLRRDGVEADSSDRRAAIDRQVRREIDKSIRLWGSGRPRGTADGVVDERFVPGHGLKTVAFLQVSPDYLDRRAERFWPYVDASGGLNTCWPWHGSERFDSGYGQVSWQGQLTPAHRVAWTLESGLDLPYDLVGDHLCQCKWCVNPDHIEPVTRGENNRRTQQRRPEETRARTSFDSPFADRWYPFGRRLYDADGNRLVVEERDEDPPTVVLPPRRIIRPKRL